MVTTNDLKGIMAMMPAFTTKRRRSDRCDEYRRYRRAYARRGQIDSRRRSSTCSRPPEASASFIRCCGTSKKLIEATVAAVKKRVPLFVGCTNLNPREAIRQAKFAQEAGADGLLLGVRFYYQATVDNAVQFYHDVADALPKMGVMIYHNPTHHRVTIPVERFQENHREAKYRRHEGQPSHATAICRADAASPKAR